MNALSRSKSWEFEPRKGVKVGDHVTGGDAIGLVHESMLVKHTIMVPPNACGTIKYIAPKGNYNVTVRFLTIYYFLQIFLRTLFWKWNSLETSKSFRWSKFGQFASLDQWQKNWPPIIRCFVVNAFWMHFFPVFKAVQRQFQVFFIREDIRY